MLMVVSGQTASPQLRQRARSALGSNASATSPQWGQPRSLPARKLSRGVADRFGVAEVDGSLLLILSVILSHTP
ncbi:hypothetical protein C475_05895 [Halosimplex carlsbadense 2-9-1]|uniref:Uncharacterized protein n=1 Tax=Halosimplex carlsbadense 2-9-1 TaxID=797114 RepID=M0CYB8_9EURY|nr:hypothetical protein C475_05895 [Halosimplex carlsbadense 2-9-1]